MLARPFALLSIVVLAVAAPWDTPTVTVTVTAAAPTKSASSCSTGKLQCCQTTETAGSPAGSLLLGLLGIVISDLTEVIGVNCSPLSIVGLGQGGCSANAVCCKNNNVGGLISVGCVPVIL